MAITPAKRMTSAEFERLPDTSEGYPFELHHGALVKVPPPKFDHFRIQRMLRNLLDKTAAGVCRAYTEVGFRPLPEGEYRVADVAYAGQGKRTSWKADNYFRGAPEPVIEVLSPSDTATEMLDEQKLCLENGCLAFGIVDPTLSLVKVSTADGRASTYSAGPEIPLLYGGRLAVDSIFTSAEG